MNANAHILEILDLREPLLSGEKSVVWKDDEGNIFKVKDISPKEFLELKTFLFLKREVGDYQYHIHDCNTLEVIIYKGFCFKIECSKMVEYLNSKDFLEEQKKRTELWGKEIEYKGFEGCTMEEYINAISKS